MTKKSALCVECGSPDRVMWVKHQDRILCYFCRNPHLERKTEKGRKPGNRKGRSSWQWKRRSAEKAKIIDCAVAVEEEKAVKEDVAQRKFEKTLKKIDINDIEKFAAIYMNHYWKCSVPPFHREIYKYLSGDDRRLVLEAPRNFAKSTILSVIYPLYLICETKIEELCSFSRSIDLAKKWISKIKNELENNQLLKYDYKLQKGETWSKTHLIVKRPDGTGCSLMAFGKGSSARGQRGEVFIDDPQNKKDVESETVLTSDEQWFFEDVLNILEPGQRLIFIGSRLSDLSLLATAAERPNWTHLAYKAFADKDRTISIWPEKWSKEDLDKRCSDIGIDRFNSEYMNDPVVADNPVFRKEWIKYYDPESEEFEKERRRGFFTVSALDPAISKKQTADESAIITVSATMDMKPNFYVRDARAGHWSMEDNWKQLVAVNNDYSQNETIVETVSYQKALYEYLTKQETIYNRYMGLIEIIPDKDKVRRSWAVQSLFQTGRVFFDVNCPRQQKLIRQMKMFTGSQNYLDDMVDALVYTLDRLRNWNCDMTQSNEVHIAPYGGGANNSVAKSNFTTRARDFIMRRIA